MSDPKQNRTVFGTDRLSEIRARLDAATPGPWFRDYEKHKVWGGKPTFMVVEQAPVPADADLISHAPADIAWLLAEVERVKVQAVDRQIANRCSRCGCEGCR